MVCSRFLLVAASVLIGAACAQPTPKCPPAPVTARADAPPPEPTAQPRADASGWLDRHGEPLATDPASATPSSLRPWVASLGEPAQTGAATSLDAALHRKLEEAFAGVERGAGVVLNVTTGGLHAIFSTLPHNVEPGLAARHLATGRPSHCGSVAKPFTAVAALAGGIIDKGTTHTCRKVVTLGRRAFHCFGEHGVLDMTRAIAVSDNAFFFEVAKQIDHDALAATQRAFGLGESNGSLPGAAIGLVRMRNDFDQAQPLNRGTTLTQAIGHNIYVTPLQMARAYAALVTGVLPATGIHADTPPPSKELPSNLREHLSPVRAAVRQAVTSEEGTAHFAGPTPDLSGKTGTAQLMQGPMLARGDHTKLGWFAGWAPADNPRIAFAFRVEGMNGRDVAKIVISALTR